MDHDEQDKQTLTRYNRWPERFGSSAKNWGRDSGQQMTALATRLTPDWTLLHGDSTISQWEIRSVRGCAYD